MEHIRKTRAAGQQQSNAKKKQLIVKIQESLEKLQKVTERFEGISRDEEIAVQEFQARCGHMVSLGSPHTTTPPTGYLEWSSQRFPILIADYLMRRGYIKTAMMVVGGNRWMVDAEIYAVSHTIVESLKRHECSLALQWCHDHAARLKKNRSSFEFQLRLQEFIELIRQGNVKEAVQYAKANLSPWASQFPQELQEAAALLVMRLLPDSITYQRMYSESRWTGLIDTFKADVYKLHNMAPTSPLEIHLQAGLASLKTPESMQGQGGQNNPLRHPILRSLATRVPFSKRTMSKLVCAVSGSIMEGSNTPWVLPSGYVYGWKSLDSLKRVNPDGSVWITCPFTGNMYPALSIKRVYIV